MNPRFPSPSPSAPDQALPEGTRQVPVVGWRTWRARAAAGGAVLLGPYSGTRWDSGSTRATCRLCPPWMANLHPVPHPGCRCGLYAFSTLEEAFHNLMNQAHTMQACGQGAAIVGAVIGWGRIVQHGGQGWRAEYARPVALLGTGHPMLGPLARHHRVPVVSARGLRLLPLEYGEALTR
ncbi:MAG: hypothetical protein J2P38_08740 [Candidatus Dormibacteraeota bacterium]|nr:hypothetical protein [Candidatus Dormibacteraeota bacterium]